MWVREVKSWASRTCQRPCAGSRRCRRSSQSKEPLYHRKLALDLLRKLESLREDFSLPLLWLWVVSKDRAGVGSPLPAASKATVDHDHGRDLAADGALPEIIGSTVILPLPL
jgi:hypothetical protein